MLVLCLTCATVLPAAEPANLELVGDWQVKVRLPQARPVGQTTLTVAPPVVIRVAAEKYDSLPVFNAQTAGWAKGRP